ncbi:MAG: alanine--tRNA ligase [Candidatus Aenigmarchaeota archaeon]|nr:alanine--tRNA ligase [Candidatus Aenigmarchaeota archaeon]
MMRMLTKDSLKKEFQRKPKEYWEVEIFREKGFERKRCGKCGKFFWTLDSERAVCADSTCEPYGFIGSPITRKKLDNVEAWRLFEKFFVKEGHTSVPRYPVIDRVRPDLYFTIASIQDFQRIENGNMTFIYPANPLIVPQMCLRFIDIPSVGLSGRHLTGFIMGGQHAFGHPEEGYFKDRCIELNFNFLTKHMGIPAKQLVYAEDIWAMPDFSAFGPSIETFSKGLEIVNHVFMQYQRSAKGFRELGIKVNDTGWGHERLAWFSQGTQTLYDAIFGPVLAEMKRQTGIRPDEAIFGSYAKLAGGLDISELRDKSQLDSIRKKIAASLGISLEELKSQVEPMQAVYAIADHTRTLLFAMADGGIPSNVGGGYNLRVLLRRSLSFINEFNLDLDMVRIAGLHAKFLKPMYPELGEGITALEKIMPIERQKHSSILDNARKVAEAITQKKEKLGEEKLLQLYESHGITPEIISRFARVDIPLNIYAKITQRHEAGVKAQEELEAEKIDTAGLEPTELLFYKDQEMREFDATVLKVIGARIVILDRTCFFAETGGQEADHGDLGGCRVYDVKKAGNVVLHYVEKPQFKHGQNVGGKIDWDRRMQLTRHHSAIHTIHGLVKKVLGSHASQAGTHKSADKAHIDVTHYRAIEGAESERLEQLANGLVEKGVPITRTWYPRPEAEKKFGINIYTGGFVPGRDVRIVEIHGEDVEACGGTHCSSTKDIGRIVVIGTERIQDGVDRIIIKAGPAAERYMAECHAKLGNMIKMVEYNSNAKISTVDMDGAHRILKEAAEAFSVPLDQVEATVKRFLGEIEAMQGELEKISPGHKTLEQYFAHTKPAGITEALGHIFAFWKHLKKEMDSLRREFSGRVAGTLAGKMKDGRLAETIRADRKTLIEIASQVIAANKNATIILANPDGDVVVMSNREDSGKLAREICHKAGGSGGGRPELGQGKADPEKLAKVLKS